MCWNGRKSSFRAGNGQSFWKSFIWRLQAAGPLSIQTVPERPSSIGQDATLSRWREGFDSPRARQVIFPYIFSWLAAGLLSVRYCMARMLRLARARAGKSAVAAPAQYLSSPPARSFAFWCAISAFAIWPPASVSLWNGRPETRMPRAGAAGHLVGQGGSGPP